MVYIIKYSLKGYDQVINTISHEIAGYIYDCQGDFFQHQWPSKDRFSPKNGGCYEDWVLI